MNLLKNQTDSIENNNKTECFTGFEGTEKRIEMEVSSQNNISLRNSVSTDTWAKMLEFAKCLIISKTSNENFDSYILSESSLFVFDRQIIMKTCGTTTLLLCLPYFLQILNELELKIKYFFFRHKNFTWPELQMFPHGNFNEEIEFLDKYFDNGKAQIIGSNQQDKWYTYIADSRENKKKQRCQFRNINEWS